MESRASTQAPSMAPSESDFNEKASTSSRRSSRESPRLETIHTASEKAEQEEAVQKTVTQQRREAEADIEYPHGAKLAVIIIGLSLAVLCVALDNTIIATAIPHITDDFHALADVGWYGSAYLLTTSAFQLFFGRLYSIFNIKWTFLITLGIFELGSLICAVAPNSTALIVGRAIAGLGSSGLFSGALIILAHAVPLQKRPVYTGVISGMYGIASVVGPLLGGVFTDRLTWRWCFYINLPLGAVTAGSLILFLQSPPSKKTESAGLFKAIMRFDPVGTVLFLPAIVSLLLALQWGGTTYAWSNGRIIGLFVVFGVLIIAFIFVQIRTGDNATVPIRVAKQRSMAFGSLYSVCLGSSFFLMVYYIPIWFQAIHGTSATQSGIDTLPMMLGVVVASIVAGGLVTTLGYYTPFTYVSIVLISIGAGLITTWTPEISTGKWIGYQIIYGVGIGFGMQQTMVAAQTVLPLEDVPTGVAIIIFSQMFGGSLFVSVGQNVFTNHLVSGLASIPGINPTAVVNTGATQIGNLVKDPQLLQAIQSIYNLALTKTFQVSLIMGCIGAIGAAGLEWKSVKGKKIEPTAA